MWLEAEVPIYPQKVAHSNFESPSKTHICSPNFDRLNRLGRRQCRCQAFAKGSKKSSYQGQLLNCPQGCFMGKIVVQR